MYIILLFHNHIVLLDFSINFIKDSYLQIYTKYAHLLLLCNTNSPFKKI